MRVLFLPNGGVAKPSPRMRVFQLLPELRKRGIDAVALDPSRLRLRLGGRTSLYRPHVLSAAAQADVVVVQKRLFGLPMLLALKTVNPRLIYDFDDAVYTRQNDPTGRPDYRAARRLHAVLRAARHVMAGNVELASYASRFTDAVTVVPTVVDLARYRRPTEHRSDTKAVVVGWTGTAGNLPCLELLRRPLAELAAERAPMTFRVVSSDAPTWSDVPLEHEQWTLDRSVDSIVAFDIGVMPLPDTPWNRGKCGFKAIEYMALGIPPVASPVGVLRTIVAHGETGFLAETPRDWSACLTALISDADLRRRLGTSARETVEKRYSLDAAVPHLVSVFEEVAR